MHSRAVETLQAALEADVWILGRQQCPAADILTIIILRFKKIAMGPESAGPLILSHDFTGHGPAREILTELFLQRTP
jgi:hypothetical protein